MEINVPQLENANNLAEYIKTIKNLDLRLCAITEIKESDGRIIIKTRYGTSSWIDREDVNTSMAKEQYAMLLAHQLMNIEGQNENTE